MEILIAIVLVGVLSAVVVVGIGRLTDQAAASACAASADAVSAATNVYFVTNGRYPTSFVELTTAPAGSGPAMEAPSGQSISERNIIFGSWTLAMSTTTPPTYSCSVNAPPSTVVVDGNSPAQWAFVDDNRQGGTGSFVSGPGTPPAGSGSAQLNIAGNAQGFILRAGGFGSTRLDSLTQLDYSTYKSSGNLLPTLGFDVRFRPTDTAYGGRLVYEPAYQAGGSGGPGWQQWSTLAGKWYASRSKTDGTDPFGSLGLCRMAAPCTWTQVLQHFPDATILPDGALLFKVGSGWGAGPISLNVDHFTIGFADAANVISATTYDFEP